ncbi:MAG: ABC transporter permease [Bacteroidales bacterium]
MAILFTFAWRNLWRNKRRTLITVSSVLFTYLLAVALLSYMGGFQEQFTESMIRQDTGYLQVQDAKYLEEPSMDHIFEYGEEVHEALAKFEDEIKYTVPRIRGFSLAAKDISTRPAMVNGIVPEQEDQLRDLSGNMVQGEMFGKGDEYAVVAAGLADLLDLNIGDTLVLIGQGFQAMSATGKFKVGGIIEFNLPEQNNTMVYLPLEVGQWYFAAGNRLTNLLIMTERKDQISQLAAQIQQELDDEWFAVRTWKELVPDMVDLMEMQHLVYNLIAWVFYIIVGFGIFGTILTMLYERMREFGILLSLGMKRYKLAIVTLIETVIIGLLGIVAGVAAGIPLIYFFHRFPIRLSGEMADYMYSFGMEPVFRFSMSPGIFITQGFIVFGITLFIGLFSMRKIFVMDVLDAARS